MLWQAGGGRRQAGAVLSAQDLQQFELHGCLTPACLPCTWLQTKSASRAQSNNPPKSSSPIQPDPATGMAGGDKEKLVSWFEESALKAATSCLGQKQGWMPTISLFSSGPQCTGLASSHPVSVETIAFQTGAVLGRGIRVQSTQPWQASAKAPLSLLHPPGFVMHPQHSLPWPLTWTLTSEECTAQAEP